MPVLEVRDLRKIFRSGQSDLEVLKAVSFTLEAGESLAVVGPSGSGKSTLLALCAGLDHPTSGSVLIDGQDLSKMSEDQSARLRNHSVGFVFQDFQLLPSLTALENVMVPMELAGNSGSENQARELLAKVGLSDRSHHFPNQLSGGEQQRVAIARAYINQPRVLFADEPTGNLDAENSEKVAELLFGITKELKRSQAAGLLVVTHDEELAACCERRLFLRSGQIEHHE